MQALVVLVASLVAMVRALLVRVEWIVVRLGGGRAEIQAGPAVSVMVDGMGSCVCVGVERL